MRYISTLDKPHFISFGIQYHFGIKEKRRGLYDYGSTTNIFIEKQTFSEQTLVLLSKK